MNILFVGTGSGSWEVRGRQVAAVMGAKATTRPNAADWKWADIAFLVKHAITEHGEAARQARIPIIWDALDFWKQPEENATSIQMLTADADALRKQYRITRIIAATRAMAKDLGGVYIPHHSRPGLAPVKTEPSGIVAYEGTKKYLGRWQEACEQAAEAHGMRFVVNPDSLAGVDVVVAFRDGKWNGEACRRWKSGVKLVNAMAAGKPVITQNTSAFREIQPVGLAIETVDQVGEALDAALKMRGAAAADHGGRAYTLDTIARCYREVLITTLGKAA